MSERLSDEEIESLRREDWEYQTNGLHVEDLLATIDADRKRLAAAEALLREVRGERTMASLHHPRMDGSGLGQRIDALLNATDLAALDALDALTTTKETST